MRVIMRGRVQHDMHGSLTVFVHSSCRDTLQRQLESLDFHIINFDTNVDNDQLPSAVKEEGRGERRSKVITERFIAEVASKCMEEAIVFLFLSGIQFPMKVGAGLSALPREPTQLWLLHCFVYFLIFKATTFNFDMPDVRKSHHTLEDLPES